MRKVTDKALLAQLNQPEAEEQNYLPKIENKPSMSAPGVFGQSAFRAAPEAIANLMLKLHLTNPKVIEEALPRNEAYEQGRMEHPLADISGSAIGFGPVGAGTSAGLRAIPAISRVIKAASPSLLKRTGIHALEGGGIGTLYAPPGQEGEGAGVGALIGGLLGGRGVSLARNAANIKRGGRNIANIEELSNQRQQAFEAHEQQQALLDAIKRQHEEQGTGLQSPESITRQINEKLALLEKQKPAANMPIESNFPDIEQHKLNLENAEHAHNEQQELIDSIKRLHKEQGAGLQSPEDIQRKINDKMQRLAELEEQASLPYQIPENLENYPTGEENLAHANKAIENKKSEISNYLQSKQPKGVEFAEEHFGSIKQAKQHIQNENYEPVKAFAKESHIRFPRTAEVKKIDEQIQSFLGDKNTISESSFDKYRAAMLKNHKPGHDLVNSWDYVEQWKDNRNAANKARRLGFKEGGDNQAHWRNEAERLQGIADKQLAVLKHHLPEDIFEKLQEGDRLWKKHITPFYGNKIYEQSRPVPNRGKIDVQDIMHEIRSNEPGQVKSRELILSKPNLTRLALGHKYAEKPVELLHANPYEQQFIDNLPELKQNIEQLRQAHTNKNIAEAYHKSQKQKIAEVETSNKELIEQQKIRLKAIHETNKLKKDLSDLKEKNTNLKSELENGKITQTEYNAAKKSNDEALKIYNDIISKKITKEKAIETSSKLDNEIHELENKRKNLSKALNDSEITKKEFKRLDKEYSEALVNKKSLKSKLSKVITVGLVALGGVGVNTVIKKLM